MINHAFEQMKPYVKHRVWIFSDLQQSRPEMARHCLTKAVNDFKKLKIECDRIWYLGDSTEGASLQHLEEMCDMQLELLRPLNIPLRYVLGNHEFDYSRSQGAELKEIVVPFYNTVKSVPEWETIPSIDSPFFMDDLGDFRIIFLSDHGDPQGRWLTTHGNILGNESLYPYKAKYFMKFSEEIKKAIKPVITVSHYPYAGGNRPSKLLNLMLPLPENVLVHFYGHAHIGDHIWAGKDCYRKISYVDNHNIPQVNVSSLENTRGNAIRSVILNIYKDNSLGIFFRNHDIGQWTESFSLKL